MKNSKVYYLAGKCLVMNEIPDFKNQFIELCKNNLIDWIQFISVCSENLVLPSIYLKFRSNGILEYLPKEINEHLLEIYELNIKRNNEILRQIISINTILTERNIVPLYLKGAGNLIDNVYEDIGERIMADIDFLVAEKDYLRCATLLLDNGYLSLMNSTNLNFKRQKHYPRIYHPSFIADVEIHRTPIEPIFEYKCTNWINSTVVNKEKKEVQMIDGSYILSDKHKTIINFTHSQIDHEGALYGKIQLRDIYDLYLFSKRVSLSHSLHYIKLKKSAIAYFAFARFVFGLDKRFFDKTNLSFLLLKWRHDSDFFYQFNQTAFSVINYFRWKKGLYGIFIRYSQILLKLFYSKGERIRIFNKIRNRQFRKNFFRNKRL